MNEMGLVIKMPIVSPLADAPRLRFQRITMLALALLLLSLVAGIAHAEETAEHLQAYLSETRRLIHSGKYPEALDHCQWFRENSKNVPAMLGVRYSFAISDWRELANLYPPAKEALIKLRDTDRSQIEENGDRNLFMEFTAINKALNEESKTIYLFNLIVGKYPANEDNYWRTAKDTVFLTKRFDVAYKYVGDLQREYEGLLAQRKHMQKLQKSEAKYADIMKRSEDEYFAKKAIRIIELAMYMKKQPEAETIAKEANVEVPDHRYMDEIAEPK